MSSESNISLPRVLILERPGFNMSELAEDPLSAACTGLYEDVPQTECRAEASDDVSSVVVVGDRVVKLHDLLRGHAAGLLPFSVASEYTPPKSEKYSALMRRIRYLKMRFWGDDGFFGYLDQMHDRSPIPQRLNGNGMDVAIDEAFNVLDALGYLVDVHAAHTAMDAFEPSIESFVSGVRILKNIPRGSGAAGDEVWYIRNAEEGAGFWVWGDSHQDALVGKRCEVFNRRLFVRARPGDLRCFPKNTLYAPVGGISAIAASATPSVREHVRYFDQVDARKLMEGRYDESGAVPRVPPDIQLSAARVDRFKLKGGERLGANCEVGQMTTEGISVATVAINSVLSPMIMVDTGGEAAVVSILGDERRRGSSASAMVYLDESNMMTMGSQRSALVLPNSDPRCTQFGVACTGSNATLHIVSRRPMQFSLKAVPRPA